MNLWIRFVSAIWKRCQDSKSNHVWAHEMVFFGKWRTLGDRNQDYPGRWVLRTTQIILLVPPGTLGAQPTCNSQQELMAIYRILLITLIHFQFLTGSRARVSPAEHWHFPFSLTECERYQVPRQERPQNTNPRTQTIQMSLWKELQDSSGPAAPHNQFPSPRVCWDHQEDAAITCWSQMCQEILTSSCWFWEQPPFSGEALSNPLKKLNACFKIFCNFGMMYLCRVNDFVHLHMLSSYSFSLLWDKVL